MSKTKFQRKGSLFCLRNLQLLPDEKKKKNPKKRYDMTNNRK